MATKLGKIVADFRTSLATKISVGDTTATLQSATDDDGVALPAGVYYFTIDGDNSQKEHIQCSLSGTSLTSIKSVSRQGTIGASAAREHRIGATVTLTNFAHIKYINDLLDGTTNLNASTPLKYDGTPTISHNDHIATKKYVDDTAFAGAPDANTTTKGVVEQATLAETKAGTATGGTGAALFSNSADVAGAVQDSSWVYAADSVGTDSYAITLTPAPTAYTTGQKFIFKAGTANTGAATLNVNALGAKTIKKFNDQDLEDNDIESGQVVEVVYDGTNMQMVSPVASSLLQSNITNTEANTLTAGTSSNADSLHVHSLKQILLTGLGSSNSMIRILDANDRTASQGFTESINGTGTITEGYLITNLRASATSGHNAIISMDISADIVNGWDKNMFFSEAIDSVQTASQFIFLGVGSVTLASTTSTARHIGFYLDGTTIYASNADGTTQTKTDITAAVGTPTITQFNTFQVVYTAGSNIKFYVNGTLGATHTTNLPNGSSTNYIITTGIQAASAQQKDLRVARNIIYMWDNLSI